MMSLLVGLQVVEGLQYNLHQLILHSNQLLEVDEVVGVVVVARHCTGCSLCSPSNGLIAKSIRFYRTQLYAEGVDEKKCYHFIYLIKDEVMDKVPKQSRDSHRAPTSKIATSKHDAS
jgi:hypothetical protein